MLTRLGRRGWGSYSADNLNEARELIAAKGFDLILALQGLPDGSGYDLCSQVAECGHSLFVGIELSRQRAWIPVVEHGERVFGDRAVPSDSAEAELEQVLRAATGQANDGTRQHASPPAPAPQDIGYVPVQIQLDSSNELENSPAQPRPSRTAAIARLQLRCARFGVLRAGEGRNEAQHIGKTKQPVSKRRAEGRACSNSGMRPHGRRERLPSRSL